MNSTLLRIVWVVVFVSVAGCATHRSPHGGPSMGLAVDVDTPLGGVDASIGVHNPNRGGGHGGHGVSGGDPCALVYGAMTAPSTTMLLNLASDHGNGLRTSEADVNAATSGHSGGAGCSAHFGARAVKYGGQNLPPPGVQMRRGGMNSSSYQGEGHGGDQQQYRRVNPREYRVPEGPRGGGYHGR